MKSVTKNYIYNLMYQLLVIVLPILTTPYLARVLGPKNIGIYSYVLSISAVFIFLGSLGVTLYAQREIAYNQNDREKYSIIFWEIFTLRLITMLVSIVVFYLIFIFRKNEYTFYFIILLFEIFSNIFDISWFFQGLEDFKKTVTRNIVVKLISVLLIFIFVRDINDLNNYFYIYIFSVFVSNLSLWFYLPKTLNKISIRKLNIKKHLKDITLLFIPQIAIEIYTVLDRTMLGYIILDKSEVGFYDQSQKIIKLLLSLVTSLGIVMLTRIANNYSHGEHKKIKQYIFKSFNVVLFLSIPMILGLISVSDSFVPIFFGDGYDKVSIIMKVISPILLTIGISNTIGVQFLLATGRQREYTISVILGAIVNLCMNVLFIPKLGAIGAAIGTVVAEFSVTVVQLFFVRKKIKLIELIKLMKNYVIAGILMYLCCLIPEYLFESNYLLIISKVIIGVCCYTFVLFLLKDKFIFEIKDRILNNFIRRKK